MASGDSSDDQESLRTDLWILLATTIEIQAGRWDGNQFRYRSSLAKHDRWHGKTITATDLLQLVGKYQSDRIHEITEISINYNNNKDSFIETLLNKKQNKSKINNLNDDERSIIEKILHKNMNLLTTATLSNKTTKATQSPTSDKQAANKRKRAEKKYSDISMAQSVDLKGSVDLTGIDIIIQQNAKLIEQKFTAKEKTAMVVYKKDCN